MSEAPVTITANVQIDPVTSMTSVTNGAAAATLTMDKLKEAMDLLSSSLPKFAGGSTYHTGGVIKYGGRKTSGVWYDELEPELSAQELHKRKCRDLVLNGMSKMRLRARQRQLKQDRADREILLAIDEQAGMF